MEKARETMVERYRRLLIYGPDDKRLKDALHVLLAQEEAAAADLAPPKVVEEGALTSQGYPTRHAD